MNSKIKHRLLGILVIVGLIVIILPFMQSGRDLTPETTAIKEPAFPDQSVQLTTSTDESHIAETKEPTPVAATTETTQEAMPAKEEVKTQPDDIIKNEHPVDATKSAPTIDATTQSEVKKSETNTKTETNTETKSETKSESKSESNNASMTGDAASDEATKSDTQKKVVSEVTKKPIKHAARHAKSSNKLHAQKQIKNNELFNIQDPSWVIQVGSYTNKANALKVVNSLRAKGYRAFIQQFSDNTRVFVGPENKQADAKRVNQELKDHMHLHGIVISYQPLAV